MKIIEIIIIFLGGISIDRNIRIILTRHVGTTVWLDERNFKCCLINCASEAQFDELSADDKQSCTNKLFFRHFQWQSIIKTDERSSSDNKCTYSWIQWDFSKKNLPQSMRTLCWAYLCLDSVFLLRFNFSPNHRFNA